MGHTLAELVREQAADGRPGLDDQISITWIRYQRSLIDPSGAERGAVPAPRPPASGASWNGDRQRYPASVIKLVYLAAAEDWIRRQLIDDDPELRRALADMIRDSANDATGLVLDLLTGTTSGPVLPPERFEAWARQRRLVNDWLATLQWPELDGCNACQKTWGDGPYGRESQFYGEAMANRNRLSTEAAARLLEAVLASELVSPLACRRMRELLSRPLDPARRAADPENQVDGFLGAGLPSRARLWSKAGWMSQARHDAAYVELDGADPFLLVVFSEGPYCARDQALLPAICRRILQVCRGL